MSTRLIKREAGRSRVRDAHGSILQVITYEEIVVVSPSLDNTPGEELTQRTWHEDMNRNILKATSFTQFLNEETGEVLTKV